MGWKQKKEQEIKQGEYESENEWIIFIMIKLNLPKDDFIPWHHMPSKEETYVETRWDRPKR